MKVIVDELPENEYKCMFYRYGDCKLVDRDCSIHNGKCGRIQSIHDFHAVKVLRQNEEDGFRIVESLSIE